MLFMKKLRPLISAILASSLIAGCTVGPNYHKPAIQTPTEYRDLRESPQVQEQAACIVCDSSLVAGFPGPATARADSHGAEAELRSSTGN